MLNICASVNSREPNWGHQAEQAALYPLRELPLEPPQLAFEIWLFPGTCKKVPSSGYNTNWYVWRAFYQQNICIIQILSSWRTAVGNETDPDCSRAPPVIASFEQMRCGDALPPLAMNNGKATEYPQVFSFSQQGPRFSNGFHVAILKKSRHEWGLSEANPKLSFTKKTELENACVERCRWLANTQNSQNGDVVSFP